MLSVNVNVTGIVSAIRYCDVVGLRRRDT
jgi:hypothetical protein